MQAPGPGSPRAWGLRRAEADAGGTRGLLRRLGGGRPDLTMASLPGKPGQVPSRRRGSRLMSVSAAPVVPPAARRNSLKAAARGRPASARSVAGRGLGGRGSACGAWGSPSRTRSPSRGPRPPARTKTQGARPPGPRAPLPLPRSGSRAAAGAALPSVLPLGAARLWGAARAPAQTADSERARVPRPAPEGRPPRAPPRAPHPLRAAAAAPRQAPWRGSGRTASGTGARRTHARTHDGPGGAAARAAPPPAGARAAPAAAPPAGPEVPLRRRRRPVRKPGAPPPAAPSPSARSPGSRTPGPPGRNRREGVAARARGPVGRGAWGPISPPRPPSRRPRPLPARGRAAEEPHSAPRYPPGRGAALPPGQFLQQYVA